MNRIRAFCRAVRDMYDRLMGRPVPLWSVFLAGLFFLSIAIGFGWAIRSYLTGGAERVPFGETLLVVASFPDLARQSVSEAFDRLKKFAGQPHGGFGLKRFPPFKDDGYLLLSNADSAGPAVLLLRLSDGRIIHKWMLSRAEDERVDPDSTIAPPDRPLFQPIHPLLLKDGSVVGADEGPLVKLDACSRVDWVIPGTFHHSIELDSDGTFWVPTVMPRTDFDPGIYPELRDDAIAHVSPDGRILARISVARLLMDAGYGGLLFGAGAYDQDPVHLNEIDPARDTTKYWKKGDLLLSSRHRSSIFIYRPSERRIVWLKTGPWLNQHDTQFLGDQSISIFDNDVIRLRPETLAVLPNPTNYTYPRGHSTVLVYDFATGKTTAPYDDILKRLELREVAAGRASILPNGDVFIDDAVNDRAFRVSPRSLRWIYTVDPLTVEMRWSRYLSAAEVAGIVPHLRCGH